MSRTIGVGSRNYTEVVCLDEPSLANGACHLYAIGRADEAQDRPAGEFGHIGFQDGPVKEVGVNGCHHEDLIAIMIDRLQHFQRGKYACRENDIALTKLEEALHWLGHRTAARAARGVEGTSVE